MTGSSSRRPPVGVGRPVERIINARLLGGDSGTQTVTIALSGGRIVDETPSSAAVDGPISARDPGVVDANGCWVAPGFIDMQVNGWGDHDLATAPSTWPMIGRQLPRFGVTAWCPTLITGPAPLRRAVLDTPFGAIPDAVAEPLGWHLEGPAISPRRSGVHPIDHITGTTVAEREGWARAAENLAIVTIAPELDGAAETIGSLAAHGVVVSLGHSDADDAATLAAIDAGATAVTHLFNASRPWSHRQPGIVGVALTDPRLTVCVIADGLHLADRTLDLVARLCPPDRLCLVSDLVATSRTERTDGVLAGATTPLDGDLRRLMAATGMSLADAVATVTSTPARLLGLSDRGTIKPGAVADLVLLDDDGSVVLTIVRGLEVPADGDDAQRA